MAGVLLDTHAFLWWCTDSPELSNRARKVIASETCHVSMATFWEIAIKASLGKLKLPSPIERYVPEQMALNGFSELDIGFRHVARCARLEWRHRDPFDRLLIAQAMEEDLRIVTRDAIYGEYGLGTVW